MKTQPYGDAEAMLDGRAWHCGGSKCEDGEWNSAHVKRRGDPPYRPKPPKALLKTYLACRENGEAADRPIRPFPMDGKVVVLTELVSVGVHCTTCMIRYVEGPSDQAWMEECDRNYILRLDREGQLDKVEPNWRTEVPKLYGEIMAAKRKAEEEAAEENARQEAERAHLEAERKRREEEKLEIERVKRDAIRRLQAQDATFTVLNLREKQVSTEEIRKIAGALGENLTVTTVDLSGNAIGDAGARMIAEALKINRTVISINLSNNQIGNEGARAVIDALRENHTITTVDLGGNIIGEEMLRATAALLRESDTLVSIRLGEREGTVLADINRKKDMFHALRQKWEGGDPRSIIGQYEDRLKTAEDDDMRSWISVEEAAFYRYCARKSTIPAQKAMLYDKAMSLMQNALKFDPFSEKTATLQEATRREAEDTSLRREPVPSANRFFPALSGTRTGQTETPSSEQPKRFMK